MNQSSCAVAVVDLGFITLALSVLSQESTKQIKSPAMLH